jgi:hypothetical protein
MHLGQLEHPWNRTLALAALRIHLIVAGRGLRSSSAETSTRPLEPLRATASVITRGAALLHSQRTCSGYSMHAPKGLQPRVTSTGP